MRQFQRAIDQTEEGYYNQYNSPRKTSTERLAGTPRNLYYATPIPVESVSSSVQPNYSGVGSIPLKFESSSTPISPRGAYDSSGLPTAPQSANQAASAPHNILGVPVYFPVGKKPFPAQLAVTSKVISALSKKCNALLESPTGTGKTLALLTSTLSWQRKMIQTTGVRYTIYYCSRTHSQLKQVVNELRNCHDVISKSVRSASIGSRTQLCTNAKACKQAKDTQVSIDEVCREYTKVSDDPTKPFCHMSLRAKDISSKLWEEKIWDIEDAVRIAKQGRGCGYYGSRGVLETNPNIVFSPYNYLIEPSIRESMKLDLTNAIVIFDEGHNIEDVCRSAASAELTLDLLQLAIFQLHELAKSGSVAFKSLLSLLQGIRSWLTSVGRILVEITRNADNVHTVNENIWEGRELLDIFYDEFGLDAAALEVYWEHFRTVMEEQEAAVERRKNRGKHGSEFGEGGYSQGTPRPARTTIAYENNGENENMDADEPSRVYETLSISTLFVLKSVLSVLRFMFMNNKNNSDDYKIVVQLVPKDVRASRRSTSTENDANDLNAIFDNATLGIIFHCMCAAVAFRDLASLTHSVLITSGTLSPLDSFAGELGTPFPVRVEAGHVINLATQIRVCAVASAWGDSLEGSYRNQGTNSYHTALGKSLLQSIQATAGGVLVFFPSYRLLENMHQLWRQNGILSEIEACTGSSVFTEPRESKDLEKVLIKYYNILDRDVSSDGKTKFTPHTAVLFAVCRGKVSEGINFTDQYARTVIVVGIPYPATNDPFVKLKRVYQDKKAVMDPDKTTITGEGWYKLQAFRAINQSVGRCIRHRYDYGAIILLDPRFQHNQVKSSLSSWVRGAVVDDACISATIDSIGPFFEDFKQSILGNSSEAVNPTIIPGTNAVVANHSSNSLESIDSDVQTSSILSKQPSYSIIDGLRRMATNSKPSISSSISTANMESLDIAESKEDNDASHDLNALLILLKSMLQVDLLDHVESINLPVGVFPYLNNLLFKNSITLSALCQKLSQRSGFISSCIVEPTPFIRCNSWNELMDPYEVDNMDNFANASLIMLQEREEWIRDDGFVIRFMELKSVDSIPSESSAIIALTVLAVADASQTEYLKSSWIHPILKQLNRVDVARAVIREEHNVANPTRNDNDFYLNPLVSNAFTGSSPFCSSSSSGKIRVPSDRAFGGGALDGFQSSSGLILTPTRYQESAAVSANSEYHSKRNVAKAFAPTPRDTQSSEMVNASRPVIAIDVDSDESMHTKQNVVKKKSVSRQIRPEQPQQPPRISTTLPITANASNMNNVTEVYDDDDDFIVVKSTLSGASTKRMKS